MLFMMDPIGSLFNNVNMNFRSFVNDETILQHILRLSEQQRGRQGTPPASKDAIEKLQQVDICDEHCKISADNKEYPRCSICCEDLTEKATRLPCGHLFNKECIGEWLNQHNQCPVCRFELPTDDAEYERAKESRMRNSSAASSV